MTSKLIVCGRGYKHDGTGKFYQTLEFCTRSPVGSTLLLVLLGVEAFFFGMFTICMLCDQYSVLHNGVNHIEQLKARKLKQELSQVSTFREGLMHIFGGDGSFSLWWLIPTDAKWKNAEKEFHFMLPKNAGALKHTIDMNDESSGVNLPAQDTDPDEAGMDSVITSRGEKAADDMV